MTLPSNRIVTLLTVVAMSISCSGLEQAGFGVKKSKDRQGESSELDAKINEALVEIREIETQIEKGLLLDAATATEAAKISDLVHGMKASLYMLRQDGSNASVVKKLQEQHDELAATHLLIRDQSGFDQLLAKIAAVLNLTSSYVEGVGVQVVLFEEAFKESLGMFQTFTTSGKVAWEVDTSRGFGKASGFKVGAGEAWLLSPKLDLTQVRDPVFVLRQAVNFITTWEDLSVLISTDYEAGNPAAASWEPLEIQTRPEGNSWAFIDSEPLSLQKYTGASVVIALRYRSQGPGAGQAATWQIGRFSIQGMGTLSVSALELGDEGRPITDEATSEEADDGTEADDGVGEIEDDAILFEELFGESLGSFQSFSASDALAWSIDTRRKLIKASGFRQGAGEVWLISPRFQLAEVSAPKLVLRQAVNFLTSWDDVEVLASTTYRAGSPDGGEWEKLEIQPKPTGTDWDFVQSEPISLARFADQGVVIAFRLRSLGEASGQSATWQLNRVAILGEGQLETSAVQLQTAEVPAPRRTGDL